jgi:tRNA modification GTPase
MLREDLDDTIAAISTPVGEAGIGIVRISGKEALKVADKIFASKGNKKPSAFKTYTTHYGWITNKLSALNSAAGIIDEVLLTVMRAPKSYTKEDSVEINCHGGIVALRRVLELVLENGCRLAQPGEFTKRAFLNGRIDLAQAEAVLDIIRAKTDSALRIGVGQLKGALSEEINKVREALLGLLAALEANIDFPEEEITTISLKEISEKLTDINKQLRGMLDSSRRARVFREGIHTVICGRPNVGKSSLLNALLKKERSIVTPVPGTTRDTVEEVIDIKGIPVRIVDTAGILEPRDLVEKKAVERANKSIASADLVILLFDGSRRLSRDDEVLMRKLKKKPLIAIINKIDLKQRIQKEKLLKNFKQVFEISAKKSKNINLLEDAIANLVYKGEVAGSESLLVSNLRHIEALREAQKVIAGAINSVDNKLSLEFIAQDIKEAVLYLEGISGKRFSEDLLDKIFSEFCIGK